MIKYRRTDKIGGDETAPYDVIFDREYTVREFIEYILTRNEWGKYPVYRRIELWLSSKSAFISDSR